MNIKAFADFINHFVRRPINSRLDRAQDSPKALQPI